ncbi:Deubiquitinase OTUD6B [Taenia solium]|eukprot:TsM_000519400 transcript=TsM_000519400 gene=TsM_000519400
MLLVGGRYDIAMCSVSLKKSVPRGDRNRRNAIQQEILALEKQLAGRQTEELRQLNASLDVFTISTPDPLPSSNSGEVPAPRVSKAAKRRKKAAAKAQSLSKAVEESLTKNASSTSALEYCQLEHALFERGLTLHKVPSDGDCLFASIAHQLEVLGLTECLMEACKKFAVAPPTSEDVKSTVRCLRMLASAVIRQKEEDYLPFICLDYDLTCNSTTAKIDLYCKNLEAPGTWGGQLEIQALSTALERPIEVLHTAGPVIRSGETFAASSNPPAPMVIT